MNPLDVVKAFMARISTQDLDGLADLMTNEHTFIDGMGTTVTGREILREGG